MFILILFPAAVVFGGSKDGLTNTASMKVVPDAKFELRISSSGGVDFAYYDPHTDEFTVTSVGCVKIGGHCWKDGTLTKNGVVYPLLNERVCIHCGQKQQRLPSRWEDVKP